MELEKEMGKQSGDSETSQLSLVDRARWMAALSREADFSDNAAVFDDCADRIEELEKVEVAFRQNQEIWSKNIKRITELEEQVDFG